MAPLIPWPQAPLGGVTAKDKQLVRLDFELRARLERVRALLSKRAGDVELVTSHVIREVIERGMDSLERELGRREKRRAGPGREPAPAP